MKNTAVATSVTVKNKLKCRHLNIILANASLAFVLVAAHIRFGSISKALDYVRGDRLLPDSALKSFGSVERGASPIIRFHIGNHSSKNVRILGTNVSCTCLVVRRSPQFIPPGGDGVVDVQVVTKEKAGDVSASLVIYSDRPGEGSKRFLVTGFVRNATDPHERELRHD